VALRGTQIVPVPLEEAVASLRTVDLDLFKIASVFFG
jgi:6-phosphofructokinase 1